MEQITDLSQQAAQNQIVVDSEKCILNHSSIIFAGKNNILYIEDGVVLKDSTITFSGADSICYLCKNHRGYCISLTLFSDSCVFFGEESFFNGRINAIASEHQNIIFGDHGCFAFGINLRTADPHLIYDCITKKRANMSKSILIGDHVWLGQNILLLKGTIIGSGSIIGGNSVIANKKIPSNCAAAGNPAKIVKKNIFFLEQCVHAWTEEETKNHEICDMQRWIYENTTDTMNLLDIDCALKKCNSAQQRLQIILECFINHREKNRFYVGME